MPILFNFGQKYRCKNCGQKSTSILGDPTGVWEHIGQAPKGRFGRPCLVLRCTVCGHGLWLNNLFPDDYLPKEEIDRLMSIRDAAQPGWRSS